ncbi:MAG: ADP-ribosylation factor family protein [Candidatus Hermodarchaeota archaeon]
MKKIFTRVDKKAQISICGLDDVGKTTILNYMLTGEHTQTVPTTGINYEQIILKKDLVFDVYDLPGQEILRNLWDKFLLSSDLLIFVLDAADLKRLDEARKLFWEVYAHQTNNTICILANKQDLEEAVLPNTIIQQFQLKKLNCKWQIFATSALTGRGIVDSFQWIYESITNNKIQMKVNIWDILIFESSGLPIASKNELLGEPHLAAGFLSAIQNFIDATMNEQIESIVLKDYRICFRYVEDYDSILTLVMNRFDNEAIGHDLLTSLAEQLVQNKFVNAKTVLHQFLLSELRGLI